MPVPAPIATLEGRTPTEIAFGERPKMAKGKGKKKKAESVFLVCEAMPGWTSGWMEVVSPG